MPVFFGHLHPTINSQISIKEMKRMIRLKCLTSCAEKTRNIGVMCGLLLVQAVINE